MCTAITYQTKDHYFGRNLDLDYVYQETVTITPRRYPLRFRQMGTLDRHYAMIGMAYVLGDYPLYYDATNEAGLSMAGLNFPGNAVYWPEEPGRDNVTPLNSSLGPGPVRHRCRGPGSAGPPQPLGRSLSSGASPGAFALDDLRPERLHHCGVRQRGPAGL